MKPNSTTQSDTTLKFDGAEKETTGRVRSSVHTNHYTGYMNDGRLVNKGRGPTTGNNGTQPVTSGTPVTKDAFRRAPDSAAGTSQKRNPSGTRAWDPKKTQNYTGNPDSIRIGQGGGTNYGAVSKSKTPKTDSTSTNFNYGPKSQY